MNKMLALLIGVLIIGAIAIAVLNYSGMIELNTEMLMSILIVIIVIEIAIMVIAFIMKRRKKKKTYQPPVPQQPPTPLPSPQPQTIIPPSPPQSQPITPIPHEVTETIPSEILEYKVPGTIKTIATQQEGKDIIGIEVEKFPPSMKFGHNVSIIKEKIEQVQLKKEPLIKELPKTPGELESVITQLIKKQQSKKSKKPTRKPKKIKKKVKKKHGTKKK